VLSVVVATQFFCHYFTYKSFRVMADHLHIVADTEGGDVTTMQAFRSTKATELLAKPKLDTRLFGYTLPERLQELRDAISLKSMF